MFVRDEVQDGQVLSFLETVVLKLARDRQLIGQTKPHLQASQNTPAFQGKHGNGKVLADSPSPLPLPKNISQTAHQRPQLAVPHAELQTNRRGLTQKALHFEPGQQKNSE